ncbi:prenyltransferase/squalene oxidase repeat-containing protein [Oscillospiraceae bacterium PP1C4]
MKRFCAAALSCALLFSVAVSAELPQDQIIFPVSEQTWQYLDKNIEGSWSITAYSLGRRDIKETAKKQLAVTLEHGIANGFQSPVELEKGLISLIKLEQDPLHYKKTNLLSSLYTYDDIYKDGLDGAVFALMAYQAADAAVPEAVRNSTAAVIDYIVSSQQRSGGFAMTAGRDPDVQTTALAVTALAAKHDIPYVSASLEKAVDWLSSQQNPDGTFSLKNLPSCEATAAVLTALRVHGVSLDDPRFVKNGHDLLDALDLFENTDGGYAPQVGQSSDVTITEQVIIALHTNQTGLSPFLSPTQYPGYVKPEMNGIEVYLKFFIGFIGMLCIIYLLLILTTKIGKKWGGPMQPQQLDSLKPDEQALTADDHTIEIHIPMKAKLPDFDTINEQETTPPHHKENTGL